VEVLIEPVVPAPLLAVVGESPAARTLGALARTVGWRVRDDGVEGADAVVVATMGHGDEDLLAAALRSGAGYVGLVASAKRAATVLAELRTRGLDEESVLRVRAPAGLDLGPSTQEEIAVAILAELVAWRHTRGESPVPPPAEAVDPVCGMTVAVGPAAEQTVHEGVTVVFCSAHCRARFEAEPERYSGLRAP
jgi:xanthine dehydrogenase accessory factor